MYVNICKSVSLNNITKKKPKNLEKCGILEILKKKSWNFEQKFVKLEFQMLGIKI